jgi:hypothetical protein
MQTVMGYEGLIFIGPAGSEATTQVTNRVDARVRYGTAEGETTVAGDGSAVPINTSRVTALSFSFDLTMLNKPADTELETLRVAAATGAPVALRLKDHAAGKGYDGDCTLSVENGKPLKGEQTLKFTFEPTDEGGRAPQLYV